MSLEAMKQVAQTEAETKQRKADAVSTAKKMISDADIAGQAKVKQARAEAEAQSRSLMEQAEKSAATQTAASMEEMKRTCEALRQSSETHLPAAAELIVRRVVNI